MIKINRYTTGTAILYLAALGIAFGLKLHYSRAAAEDLFWILSPTAGIVGWMTGMTFIQDSVTGFINAGSGIAIAPVCSGVNFLIIVFAMLFLSFSHRVKTVSEKTGWLVLSLVSAFSLTLAVNSIRISLSIATITNDIHFGWLTPDRIHRLEGIVIYFISLSLFYQGADRVIRLYTRAPLSRRPLLPAPAPLLWYLFMVLIVPVLTGNFLNHTGRFFEHGLAVVITCCGLFVLAGGLRFLFKTYLKKVC